ncbi:MAG: hypothetical protein IPN34_09660 [Planctomycetes bacterium]|nr:hypothetical protein [Planctomycetota bacterium]
MSTSFRFITACGALASLAAMASPQEALVTAGVERAKVALERNDSEAASQELRSLDAAIEAVPSSPRRTTLRNQVQALAKRADPRYAARAKALDTAAKALVKAAKTYASKRWHRTALELAELAARLAPQHAAAARDEARLAAQSAPAAPASDLAAFFAKSSQPYKYEGRWTLQGNEIHSPEHLDPLPTMLLSSHLIEERDFFIEVEARTEGQPGEFALAFGWRGSLELALLELFYLERTPQNPLGLSEQRFLLHLANGEYQTLATRYPSVTPRERRGWVKLRVEVRGPQLRGIVGGFSVLEAEFADRPLMGRFGLFVSSASAWKGVTRFRNLRWGPLEEPAAKR